MELVQLGDLYFVREGHHRISVAQAMGQESIDAEVTVWLVEGMLPWEEAADQELSPSPDNAVVSSCRAP